LPSEPAVLNAYTTEGVDFAHNTLCAKPTRQSHFTGQLWQPCHKNFFVIVAMWLNRRS
jgi:hypothetical protein